jgi:Thioesterase-like superfamily
VPDAFFESDGEAFVPTELTRGPWDPNAQHAGPPAALLGREIEGHARIGGPALVGRVTCEILRSVPLAPLTPATTVLRPGRRVELVESRLSDTDGEVMRATAWLLRNEPVEIPPGLTPDRALPGPETGEAKDFFDSGHGVGYHTGMEHRFVSGAFLEPGPATVLAEQISGQQLDDLFDLWLFTGEKPPPEAVSPPSSAAGLSAVERSAAKSWLDQARRNLRVGAY